MAKFTKTQMLVLDSTADDWENLEQIYRSVCLDFSAENYEPSNPKSFYWREGPLGISLAEVIDELRSLVEDGLMAVKDSDGTDFSDFHGDLSYLWRGYFRMTAKGRRLLDEAVASGRYADLWPDEDSLANEK